MQRLRNILENRIWILTAVMLAALLVLGNGSTLFQSSLALEQNVRCGLTEHVHGEECYKHEILSCKEKAHVHSERCYLVLLKDNDINSLLIKVDSMPGNSMEALIGQVIDRAIWYGWYGDEDLSYTSPGGAVSSSAAASSAAALWNQYIASSASSAATSSSAASSSWTFFAAASSSQSGTGAASSGGLSMYAASENGGVVEADLAQLNANVVRGNIEPSIVLNEGLTTTALVPQDTQAIQLAAPGASGGVSTLAVGGTPVTSGNVVNFYIMLDQTDDGVKNPVPVFVNSGQLSTVNTNYSYSYSDAAKAYTDAGLVTALTSGNINSTYYFRYTRNVPTAASLFDLDAGYAYDYWSSGYCLTFGSYYGASGPRQATFATRTGSYNNYTYTPVNFYTVTLDYSQTGTGTANQVQYVQEGLNSTLTLDENYFWYTNPEGTGATVTADTLQGITQVTTLYAKPKNRTVTYQYENGTQIGTAATVAYNGQHTVRALPNAENYRYWTDGTNNYAPNAIITNIKNDITLTAVPWRSYTVTYKNADGSIRETVTVSEKTPDHTIPAPPADCIWVDESGNQVTVSSVTVTENLTFTAVPANYTVTYRDANGNKIDDKSATVPYQGDHTVASLPAGCKYWTDGATTYEPGDEISDITENITLRAVKAEVYTVTYKDENGNVLSKQNVSELDAPITLRELPAGSTEWQDSNGISYVAGTPVKITSDMTFTAISRKITVKYNLNYTENLFDQNGNVNNNSGRYVYNSMLQLVAKPYLDYGSDNQTSVTLSNVTAADAPMILLNSTMRTVVPEKPSGEAKTVYFLGWDVNGDKVVDYRPGERMEWADLAALAGDDDEITFTGVWDGKHADHTVNFFIQLSANALDSNGQVTDQGSAAFTGLLYAAHLFTDSTLTNFGSQKNGNHFIYSLSGDELKSVTVDKQIRSLYGQGTYIPEEAYKVGSTTYDPVRFYMVDFPTDDQIFDQIRASKRTDIKADVGNGGRETITDLNKLNSDNYTIRWYVIKAQSGTWHVDGKIIKKTGQIQVTKNLEGDSNIINLVKKKMADKAASGDHFIYAVCEGYYDQNGGWHDYSASQVKVQRLYFKESTDPAQGVVVTNNPNTGDFEWDYGDGGYTYDADTDTYYWNIINVDAGEAWVLTEDPPTMADFTQDEIQRLDPVDLNEWITTDSTTGNSEVGFTTSSSVSGVAKPSDEEGVAWMHAEFTNMYHNGGSMLIHKVDGVSHRNLSGASFEFSYKAKSGSWVPMGFKQVTEEGYTYYQFDKDTTPAALPVDELGYLSLDKVALSGVPVRIVEKNVPTGYNAMPPVYVYVDGEDTNGNGTIEDSEKILLLVDEDGNPIDNNETASVKGGVLILNNYSSASNSVQVTKHWQSGKSVPVEITLMANGNLATTIPGLKDYVVWLAEDGAYTTRNANGTLSGKIEGSTAWTHTWKDLPDVLDGNPIVWSVQETQIDDEVDYGTNLFPNYTVSVSQTGSVDDEGNAMTVITVTNNVRAAQILLQKVDSLGNSLSGASFTLTEVDSNGNAVSGGIVRTGTTDAKGQIPFTGLKYEHWFRLEETDAPAGYMDISAAYVKLNVDGTVTVTQKIGSNVAHGAVTSLGPQTVTVTNTPYPPLPDTGSGGTALYRWSGSLLMAAAALLLIDKRPRRKEGAPS